MTDQIPTPTLPPALPPMMGLVGVTVPAAEPMPAAQAEPMPAAQAAPATFVPPGVAAPAAQAAPPPPPPPSTFVPPGVAAPAAQAAPPAQELVPVAAAPAPAPAQELVPVAPQTAQAVVTIGPDGWPESSSLQATCNTLGFVGVDFDMFGIVPLVRLHGTEFLMDEKVMPPEFYAQLHASRPKYLFSYGDPDSKNTPKGTFYTYDRFNDANSERTLRDFEAEAAQHGLPVKNAEYYEVDAILLESQTAVKLSVPKRGSGSAFARFLSQCAAVRRPPSKAVVLIKKGERVTKVDNPFYPWCFEIAGWNP